MPRKKKRGQGKPEPTFPARFAVGDRVRVKPGTADPNFKDIPLGGWAGTISELDRRSNPPTYLIEWNQHTLDQIHPIFRTRCERDGLDVESAWLGEADLEADGGEPAAIEQPTTIVARPLRPGDQDDRVRAVFGLSSDDLLPAADEDNLRRYHDYLATHLSFPFRAVLPMVTDRFGRTMQPVTVVELLPPEECDEEAGLLCKVHLWDEAVELPLAVLDAKGHPGNRRLIDDYSYWFANWPAEGFADTAPLPPRSVDPLPDLPSWWAVLKALARYGFYGAGYGLVLGSFLATVWGEPTAAVAGAVILGFILCVTGTRYGPITAAVNGIPNGALLGGFVGALIGAAVGALVGALVMAVVGTLPGAIAGGLLGKILRRNSDGLGMGILLGAAVGGLGLAFFRDQVAATSGALQGAGVGAGAGAMLVLAGIGLLKLLARGRGWREE